MKVYVVTYEGQIEEVFDSESKARNYVDEQIQKFTWMKRVLFYTFCKEVL